MKLVWVAPTDRGGGAIWVADSCCRQAAVEEFDANLLTLEPLSEATRKTTTYPAHSLDATPPYADTPARFLAWIEEHRPDVVFLNNVDTMDCCIPYLPPTVRCVYVVHDTMTFYHNAAVRHEASLDAVVAVSEATASRFRHKLRQPARVHVIRNGTVFPPISADLGASKTRDLVFLGAADPRKGAYDVLAVWPQLIDLGFSGTLHWYGRIPEDFVQRIGALPQSARIVRHGHLPRAQVFARLETCGALLMLSRGEACSISALESMAMGCIPVAWDIELTGTKEIVPEGLRYLAPLGDFQAAARQTLAALESDAGVKTGLAEIARREYTEAKMWAAYKDLIARVDLQPRAARPRAGLPAPAYRPPLRASYLIPNPLWKWLRPRIARSAKAYYFLRRQL